MQRFACESNLHFKVDFGSRHLLLQFKHKHHPPYLDIQLSPEALVFIAERVASQPPSEIYHDLVAQKVAGFENITESQIYYRWKKANKELRHRTTPLQTNQNPILEENFRHNNGNTVITTDDPIDGDRDRQQSGHNEDSVEDAQHKDVDPLKLLERLLALLQEQQDLENTQFIDEVGRQLQPIARLLRDIEELENEGEVPRSELSADLRSPIQNWLELTFERLSPTMKMVLVPNSDLSDKREV
ncbi:uncharacterized protein BROUX77_001868 [Berkeleyomyces rouxiae]|uniref:uncharacterized protein n=1 Tax=Berkeleyomyces rouxiae TaxID=2035830 RepID=UPI003B7A35EF